MFEKSVILDGFKMPDSIDNRRAAGLRRFEALQPTKRSSRAFPSTRRDRTRSLADT
jgi:hypothetical protein